MNHTRSLEHGAKALVAGLLMLTSLFLTSCQRKQVYSGDWRQLRRGEKDDRWGYVDNSGKWAIEPKFKWEADFSEGIAAVLLPKKGKGYGYIDKTGAWVAKPQFSLAWNFSEGLAAVCDRKAKWGFIDMTGKYAISPQFEEAHYFSEGLAAVKIAGKWGYIDKRGKFVIPPRFDASYNVQNGESVFSGGVAVIRNDSPPSFELIDRNGDVIKRLSGFLYRIHRFRDGLAWVEMPESERSGRKVFRFINRTGEFAFSQTFYGAGEFSEGLAVAFADGAYGYIDTTGRFVIPPRFPIASGFSEGLAVVKLDTRDTRSCYIDKTGRIVIQPLGDGRAGPFKAGLAAVDLNSPGGYLAKGAQWGYIDKTGKVVCTFTRGRSAQW